jgi:alkyl sulfatase BDS1-like metallo-beta-lactamase superfamily hydrolase
VLRYLSLDWLDALGEEVEGSDALQEAAVGRRIRVTQVVTDGPEGEVTYHLEVDDGKVRFGPGVAADEQVRFVQDWSTAVAVATGALNAQEAFISGRIKLIGDQQRLLDAVPVFAALDTVFSTVRERTDYA